MKNTKNNAFPMPKLRVSHKVYIRVMEAALDESLTLDPEMGFELMCAVRSYLHTQRNAPIGRYRIYKIFRRYREIIDAAALRSARARAAAQRRRESHESTRESVPESAKPHTPPTPTDTAIQPQCRDMPPACLRTTPVPDHDPLSGAENLDGIIYTPAKAGAYPSPASFGGFP